MRHRCVRFNSVGIDGKKEVLWCRVPTRAKVVDGMLTMCGVGVALVLEVKRKVPTCHFCKTGDPRP